jgi:putative ABC transport system permease protein
VAIISRGLWEQRFGADPKIVSRSLMLGGELYEVVGVVHDPNGRMQVYYPLDFSSAQMLDRNNHFLRVYARLKQGVTIAQAQKDMDRISTELQQEVERQNLGHASYVIGLREQMVGRVRPSLLVLAGAVGFVLLIACANVGNLLLARGASTRRELAIRQAIGAGRFQVLRQYAIECLWLGLFSAAASIPIALLGTNVLKASAPGEIPLLSEARLDFVVLFYTLGLAALTAVLSGLGAALYGAWVNPSDALKESNPAGGGSKRTLRTGLIVSEIALAFVLLAGTGLMIRSLWNLLNVSPGFDPNNVITMPIALSRVQLQNRPTSIFFSDLMDKVRVLHGVAGVALTSHIPMGGNDGRIGIGIEGRDPDPKEPTRAHGRFVSPEYFETMRIPLIQGRLPSTSDLRNDFPAVVLINRTAALKYWPGQDPVGKRIRMYGPDWREIIGVVDDVKFWGLSKPVNPEVYLPLLRNPAIMVVRVDGNVPEVMTTIREEVRKADANLPIANLRTMEDVIGQSEIAPPRFYLGLLASFGGLAVILAAAGIYGVISYIVAQRTREIGIRMALGARPQSVLRSVLRHAFILTLISLALGIAASISLTRWMKTMLFGVQAIDPLTMIAMAVVVVSVAVLASYVPARRAAKIDPIEALRHQ